MATIPWPYIDGADGEPQPGWIANLPSEEGVALGEQLARFADQEYSTTGRDTRCESCAFRLGTPANRSLATTANALKCSVENDVFNCHESDRPCGGWVSLVRSKEVDTTDYDANLFTSDSTTGEPGQ